METFALTRPHPLRLGPGVDLRGCLEAAPSLPGLQVAPVLRRIGSLGVAPLRFAGAERAIQPAIASG